MRWGLLPGQLDRQRGARRVHARARQRRCCRVSAAQIQRADGAVRARARKAVRLPQGVPDARRAQRTGQGAPADACRPRMAAGRPRRLAARARCRSTSRRCSTSGGTLRPLRARRPDWSTQARISIRQTSMAKDSLRRHQADHYADRTAADCGSISWPGIGADTVFKRRSGIRLSTPIPPLYTRDVFKQITQRSAAGAGASSSPKDGWVWGEAPRQHSANRRDDRCQRVTTSTSRTTSRPGTRCSTISRSCRSPPSRRRSEALRILDRADLAAARRCSRSSTTTPRWSQKRVVVRGRQRLDRTRQSAGQKIFSNCSDRGEDASASHGDRRAGSAGDGPLPVGPPAARPAKPGKSPLDGILRTIGADAAAARHARPDVAGGSPVQMPGQSGVPRPAADAAAASRRSVAAGTALTGGRDSRSTGGVGRPGRDRRASNERLRYERRCIPRVPKPRHRQVSVRRAAATRDCRSRISRARLRLRRRVRHVLHRAARPITSTRRGAPWTWRPGGGHAVARASPRSVSSRAADSRHVLPARRRRRRECEFSVDARPISMPGRHAVRACRSTGSTFGRSTARLDATPGVVAGTTAGLGYHDVRGGRYRRPDAGVRAGRGPGSA